MPSRINDLAPRLVRAATVDGARALGMAEGDGRVGAIEKGARADFAVLGIDANLDTVEHVIVAHGAGSCTSTIIAGERVPAQRPTRPRRWDSTERAGRSSREDQSA